MKQQEDTSTSLSASSSLRSGQKTKKSPSTVRQFDKAHCRRRSPQASLSGAILQKLDTLENLLKKKDDKPLTFKEACAYLGYAPSYLYKLTYRNVIPHYKPTGKIIFFSKAELDEWIYKSRVERGVQSDDSSTSLGVTNENECKVKDPNQVDMFEKQKDENEILIEFPLKSRRKAFRQAHGNKENN